MRRIGLSKASHSKTGASAPLATAPLPPAADPVLSQISENPVHSEEENEEEHAKRHKHTADNEEDNASQAQQPTKPDAWELASQYEAAAHARFPSARLPSLSRAWHAVLAAK